MENALNVQGAYGLLCTEGEQFLEPRETTQLKGLTFEHPRKGTTDIAIDQAVLLQQGMVYTGDPMLRQTLSELNIATEDLASAGAVIQERREHGRVWGFSGYATGGFSYKTDAAGLTRLYDHLVAKNEKPALAVDGGVSAGSLGLSGIVAAMNQVPTMGMIPRQGLSSIGVRDHLVVWGDTYQDREVMVGTTPDVLVCIGGSEGTQRECQTALRWGTPVLLLALNDAYAPSALPNAYKTLPDMVSAVDSGTMIVCRSMDAIPSSVDALLDVAANNDRSATDDELAQLLAAK